MTVAQDNARVELTLYDTAGQEDYNGLRGLFYPAANVILIAFSIRGPASLDNVEQKVSCFYLFWKGVTDSSCLWFAVGS